MNSAEKGICILYLCLNSYSNIRVQVETLARQCSLSCTAEVIGEVYIYIYIYIY